MEIKRLGREAGLSRITVSQRFDSIMLALSIRGPWWWFILHGEPPKRYENRSWDDAYTKAQLARCPAGSHVLIHAAHGMTRAEFRDGCAFARNCGVVKLPPESLRRGGIVGVVRFEGIVRESRDPWFEGPLALVFSLPYPLPFRKCPGALGFFQPDYELAAIDSGQGTYGAQETDGGNA